MLKESPNAQRVWKSCFGSFLSFFFFTPSSNASAPKWSYRDGCNGNRQTQQELLTLWEENLAQITKLWFQNKERAPVNLPTHLSFLFPLALFPASPILDHDVGIAMESEQQSRKDYIPSSPTEFLKKRGNWRAAGRRGAGGSPKEPESIMEIAEEEEHEKATFFICVWIPVLIWAACEWIWT